MKQKTKKLRYLSWYCACADLELTVRKWALMLWQIGLLNKKQQLYNPLFYKK